MRIVIVLLGKIFLARVDRAAKIGSGRRDVQAR